jgi:hypothetical protein
MHPSKTGLVGTLHGLPLFTDLSGQELALIAENASRLQFEAGTTIFLGRRGLS